jgi:hypothetical protein
LLRRVNELNFSTADFRERFTKEMNDTSSTTKATTEKRLSVRVPTQLSAAIDCTKSEIKACPDDAPIEAKKDCLLTHGLNLLTGLIKADTNSIPDTISVRSEDRRQGFSFFCPVADDDDESVDVALQFSSTRKQEVDDFCKYCDKLGLNITPSAGTRWALRAAVLTMPYILQRWKVGRRTPEGFTEIWPGSAADRSPQTVTVVAANKANSKATQKKQLGQGTQLFPFKQTPANSSPGHIRLCLQP